MSTREAKPNEEHDDPPPRALLVVFPWAAQAPYKFTSQVVQILSAITSRTTVITGAIDQLGPLPANVHAVDVGLRIHRLSARRPLAFSAAAWVAKNLLIQWRQSVNIFQRRKETDLIIFYASYPYFLLPLLTSRLLGIPGVEVVTRPLHADAPLSKRLYQALISKLLSRIAPEGRSLIDRELSRTNGPKLTESGLRFIDASQYQVRVPLAQRAQVVTYLGRIEREKGVFEFLEAAAIVSSKRPETEFRIIGSGSQVDEVRQRAGRLAEGGAKVNVMGFVSEGELGLRLNESRLLVLPSRHAEGFPTVVMEALACGTPVVATAVGAIPEAVIPGRTGWLLQSTDPAHIAAVVLDALDAPDLAEISRGAAADAQTRFTFADAERRWKVIVSDTAGSRPRKAPRK